jgi:phage terminase small subunit
MRVTSRQEVFCQAVANGSNYSNAYRQAYPRSKKWSDKSVNHRASKLYTVVFPRIEEIKAELAQKNLWTREQSVMVLREIAEQGEKGSERVAAVKELNSMHGFNEPKKHDHTSSDGSMTPRINEVIYNKIMSDE